MFFILPATPVGCQSLSHDVSLYGSFGGVDRDLYGGKTFVLLAGVSAHGQKHKEGVQPELRGVRRLPGDVVTSVRLRSWLVYAQKKWPVVRR